MAKKSRLPVLERPSAGAEVPVVGQREPCPCGSGKRYKMCHGRAAKIAAVQLVGRPFEGLPGECDLVAMREIVPAATAPVRLRDDLPDGVPAEYAGREITLVTLLPMAWPALHRADGAVLVALQTPGASGDASRDIAAALLRALELEPGNAVTDSGLPGPGPRLQDLIAPGPLVVSTHEGFGFWFDDPSALDPAARESLEQADASVVPTRRLEAVEAAYWVEVHGRRHLRWVLPDDEAQVVDGLSRLHAAGESALLPGSRYVGSFRAQGLIVPVWDLAADTEAGELEEPMTAFSARLHEAMSRTTPLTDAERRARAGVVSRQLTLR